MIGIYLGTKDEVFSIQKIEDLDVYIRDLNNMTIGEMKRSKSRNNIVFRKLFKGIIPLLTGGATFGLSSIVGDFMLIQALVIDDCVITWNIGVVVIIGKCVIQYLVQC